MRIERLDLHSYGHFRGQSLDLSAPTSRLVIVLGPNEAGKSTAMRALDALLFGIARSSSDHFGQGRPSLRVGGRLVSAKGAVLEAVRQGLNSAPLVDAEGTAVPEAAMLEMLGNSDRALFQTLFKVDHDELSNGSAALLETDGEIGRLVFGASLGSAVLTDVLRQLDARAAKLFRSGAKSTDAHASLLAYRRLAKEAREKRVKAKTWSDLDQRLSGIEREIVALRERRRELTVRQSRLQRIKSALPLLSERSLLSLELADLKVSGPVLSSQWAAEVQRVFGELASATREQTRAREQHGIVVAKLADVEVDEELLANVDRIGDLIEGAGRYRKDRRDVPKLEELLSGHQHAVAELLVRLGAPPDVDADTLTRLTDAQRNAVDELAQLRTGIDTDLDRATTEVDDLDRAISTAEAHLDELPIPPDTSTLSRAIDSAKSLGPIEEQLAKLSAALEGVEESANDLVRRLGLGELGLETFAGTAVPTRARVLRERTERTGLSARRSDLETRVNALLAEQRELVEERASLKSDVELPDHAALEVSREDRERGWRLVRASLEGTREESELRAWTLDEALPDVYERSVHVADAIADRRYEHAAQLTTVERIAARLDLLDSRLEECETERSLLDQQERDLEQAWREQWADLGAGELHPDEALEWLETHGEALELLDGRRAHTIDIGQLTEQIDRHRTALGEALTALGTEPAEGSVALRIREAEDVVAELYERRGVRERAQHDLALLHDQRPGRVAGLDRCEAALESWSQRWATALSPIGIPAGSEPAAVLTSVKLRLDLRKARSDERRDGGRLQGLLNDITSYEESAGSAIAELAPDLSGRDLADSISALNARLRTALENRARQSELIRQRDDLGIALDDAQTTQDEAAQAIESLRASAELDVDADLPAVAERSIGAAALRERIGALETTLISQGDGKTVAAIEGEANEYDMDGDRVAAELAQLSELEEGLDGELGDANTSRGQIQQLLRQIDGSGDAADLDQEAEEELARTAQLLDEYTKVALASALLKRVVSAYGEQHQRPILDDAADTFRSLTLGAFEALVVDSEAGKQVLLAKRRNGELLRTGELSSGTRDQLYLALRLAGVRHHLERVEEPLPLILDDLLVNCDDDRVAATLAVLAYFAARTQVLMFTHERSLAELALETLGPNRCAVKTLAARDHDAPPIPASLTEPNSSRAPRTADLGLESRLLDCLRSSPVPLGKATLLEQARIPEDAWQPTIKALIDQGGVVQEDQKRGAKYRATI